MRIACLFAAVLPLAAYNAPVDTAGPLTATISGPDTVLQTGAAVPIAVRLQNKGSAALSGTLRLRVVDTWRAAPGSAVFDVAAGATATLNFTITAGEGTYNAYYPVHAFAEFAGGVAHPILILQAKMANPPVARQPLKWVAQQVATDSAFAVWRYMIRRTVIQVFGKEARVTDINWQGTDAQTHAYVQFGMRVQRGDFREALAIHPPYYQGQAGDADVEFPLELPAAKPIKLRFANAIRDNTATEPPSDGVTFRVRVVAASAPAGTLGSTVFERHTATKVWLDGEADLSAWAGQSVRLQLESDPGPRRDTTCDLSYWAEPTLSVGAPPAAAAFPPPEDGTWRSLGKAGEFDVRVRTGIRGLLDSAVAFGPLMMQGFRVQVLGDALADWRSPTALLGVRDESAGGRYRLRHLFRSWAGSFDLLGETWLEAGVLRVRWWLENVPPRQPWLATYIEDAAAGQWSATASRVYAGVGNVLEKPSAFTLGFDGHRLATSFVGFDFPGVAMVQAVDVPPINLEVEPASQRYTIHAAHNPTFAFTPARTVWDAVKTWREGNGLKAAGGVSKLAGRFVFDLWGGRYGDSAAQLSRAFKYGLTDAVVVWHNWQRWGYDYRLPDIWPPNPQYGTPDEFAGLANTCRQSGVLFAPHDNYIDFYPDAEEFSFDHIAFTSGGAPVLAWYNESRDAQSYRWRPDHLLPFVSRNLPLIRDAIAPTGYFIDVWSSAGPHDYWTRDGQFFDRISTRAVWGETFAAIREFLGDNAPTISESGHDQLIGWLDGAQTNHLRVDPGTEFGWAVRATDSERIPWLDAAHHDRFALHGAGYENRYAGGLDTRMHGMYSDDYMATEALDGHPPMVKEPFSRDVVRKYWLLHDVMRVIALTRMDAFEFDKGNLHRQHVTWNNGGEIWVNRGADDWTAAGHTLPPYGLYARVPWQGGTVEAAIERRDGVIVDWSISPGVQYANARPPVSDRLPLTVAVDSTRYLGNRRFEMKFRWNATGVIPDGVRIFVHYVDDAGNIIFQGDHAPPARWGGEAITTATVNIPASVAAGQVFGVRVGLYRPGDGARYLPEGQDDGARRIHLGTLKWTGDDAVFTAFVAPPDPWLTRQNPASKPIRFFDAVTTNGAVRIAREDYATVITPLPGGPAFDLRLRLDPGLKTVEALDEAGNVLASGAAQYDNGELVLTRDPAVFAYRLR